MFMFCGARALMMCRTLITTIQVKAGFGMDNELWRKLRMQGSLLMRVVAP